MGVSAQSPFVVRVAGMPVSTVTALSSGPLAAVVRNALASERAVAAGGRELADELHPVIGALVDAVPRPGLVGLRRALFQARAPRATEWSTAVRRALPTALADRIADWMRLRDERDRLLAAVAGVLAGETERTLAALLDAAADPGFRHGLVQSSPALSAEVEKWLAGARGRPARQASVRLARYLSRAATKTSPYSTFTGIGAGVWAGTDGPVLAACAPAPPRGLLELHGPVLSELATTLSTCDDLRARMLVRANPSLTALGDRLSVIGPPPVERIASVAALPEVLSCIEALRDGWRELRWLRARLSAGAPAAAAPAPVTAGVPATAATAPAAAGAPAAKVGAFVDRLIELGILELRLPVPDQCRDWFGALATWLDGTGTPRWVRTARACARLSALLRRPTDPADVGGHRSRLAEIRQAVAELRASAGLPADPAGTSALLHEHTAFVRPVAVASRPRWQAALADLGRVGRWLAPHDPALPMRIALSAYFQARFGRGAALPFLPFYRDLMVDLDRYAAGAVDAAEPTRPALADLTVLLRPEGSIVDYHLPALRSLAALRLRSIAAVLDAPPDADGVVRVALDRQPRTVDGHPFTVRPARSVAWYLQPDGDRLVLNAAMSGYGRGRLRPLYLIAETNGGRLPADLQPSTSDGCELVADSSGAFGHTLNLRLADAGHELDYPYTVRLTERRPRIRVADLRVEHDAATGSLRLRDGRSGTAVTVAHTGMVVHAALPRALQLLTSGLGANPSWLYRPEALLAPPGDAVGFAPRIEAGLIVLRRATWSAPSRLVPCPAPGEPAADTLLRLHRWLAAHGIPDRCFVTAGAGPASPWKPGAGAGPASPPKLGAGAGPASPSKLGAGAGVSPRTVTKDRKPLYVDFGSPWLTATFNHLIAGTDRVTFCEVLPDLGDPHRHVTELVLETTGDER